LGNYAGDTSRVLTTPTKASLPGRVLDIASGGSFNFARLEDGTFLTWGKNDDGQLGGTWAKDGTLEKGIPKRPDLQPPGILKGKEVRAFGCCYEKSFAILKEGELLIWGKDQESFWYPEYENLIMVRVPVPHKQEIWAKIFKWLILGRTQAGSVFFRLPQEVLYHMIIIHYN
jgi:hypothetical protein